MCAQRTLKHVRATYALGAFHGRFLHRSERRASSRCEQSIIDIRSVVTAAEIMLPSSAGATRGPLPIDRVTKYIDHGNLYTKVFGLMDRLQRGKKHVDTKLDSATCSKRTFHE